jgi:hypothetical protein
MGARAALVRWSCGGSLTAAAILALAAGCGGSDNRPARWSYVVPAIIEPSCATASCHSAVAARAGVVLDSPASAWRSLVVRQFVVARDPEGSALLHLLRADGVRRMPPDFALPEADIQLITAWIDRGAMDD